MRAIDFDEIEVGNLILVDQRIFRNATPFQARRVTGINEEFRSISVEGMILDITPNEDDQYILVDEQ